MTDSEALLRSVCSDPHCDTRRLVYADSLQEQGRDSEAELIRLSLKPTAANLSRRRELERELRPGWERQVPN